MDKQDRALTWPEALFGWSVIVLGVTLLPVTVAAVSGESVWAAFWQGILLALLIALLMNAGIAVLKRRRSDNHTIPVGQHAADSLSVDEQDHA